MNLVNLVPFRVLIMKTIIVFIKESRKKSG